MGQHGFGRVLEKKPLVKNFSHLPKFGNSEAWNVGTSWYAHAIFLKFCRISFKKNSLGKKFPHNLINFIKIRTLKGMFWSLKDFGIHQTKFRDFMKIYARYFCLNLARGVEIGFSGSVRNFCGPCGPCDFAGVSRVHWVDGGSFLGGSRSIGN